MQDQTWCWLGHRHVKFAHVHRMNGRNPEKNIKMEHENDSSLAWVVGNRQKRMQSLSLNRTAYPWLMSMCFSTRFFFNLDHFSSDYEFCHWSINVLSCIGANVLSFPPFLNLRHRKEEETKDTSLCCDAGSAALSFTHHIVNTKMNFLTSQRRKKVSFLLSAPPYSFSFFEQLSSSLWYCMVSTPK